MPRNLNISRRAGVTIAVLGVILALAGVLIAGIVYDALTAPVLVTFVTVMGTSVSSLVAALKATEAADTASRMHGTIAFTASQNAALMQTQGALMQALGQHCGDLCPLESCPLRKVVE